jgi:hypothetical protein
MISFFFPIDITLFFVSVVYNLVLFGFKSLSCVLHNFLRKVNLLCNSCNSFALISSLNSIKTWKEGFWESGIVSFFIVTLRFLLVGWTVELQESNHKYFSHNDYSNWISSRWKKPRTEKESALNPHCFQENVDGQM